MAETEVKYYDVGELTKENSYYGQLIFRCRQAEVDTGPIGLCTAISIA